MYYDFEPGEWGQQLAHVREILFACLEASGTGSILEIGASEGGTTRPLLEWAKTTGARVTAVEPAVKRELEEVLAEHPELELIRKTSLEALPEVVLPDAVIIDGDHNYYTVSAELQTLWGRAPDTELPLIFFHDVAWPHARRDAYYAPERIPEQHRQPIVADTGLVPGDPGVDEAGLPFDFVAEREGGPRNGVLTAIEDFVEGREGLRLAVMPIFFGFGVLWHEGRDWADAVAEIIEPWDRSPVLERLEANRVVHLAAYHAAATRLHALARQGLDREQLLRAMLGSRAFTVAEQLSRLSQRGEPVFSRDKVRRALGDRPG